MDEVINEHAHSDSNRRGFILDWSVDSRTVVCNSILVKFRFHLSDSIFTSIPIVFCIFELKSWKKYETLSKMSKSPNCTKYEALTFCYFHHDY